MSTETEFPEIHWTQLQSAMETDGAPGVIAFIDGIDDPRQRLELYRFALGAFSNRPWAGKNMDAIAAVGNAGIDAALERATGMDDPERARGLTDFANMLSYNLSAALAECWPGDPVPRERRHFEEGLRAAENCIRWREELDKPPSRRAIAYWALGMHALSLRDLPRAQEGFGRSLEYATAGTSETGRSADLSLDGDFNVILSTGYLGIAEAVAGDTAGAERYRRARAAFEQQTAEAGDAEVREDAAFGLAQIDKVAGLFGIAQA